MRSVCVQHYYPFHNGRAQEVLDCIPYVSKLTLFVDIGKPMAESMFTPEELYAYTLNGGSWSHSSPQEIHDFVRKLKTLRHFGKLSLKTTESTGANVENVNEFLELICQR